MLVLGLNEGNIIEIHVKGEVIKLHPANRPRRIGIEAPAHIKIRRVNGSMRPDQENGKTL
jgi:sRNA-binding carbon storage regulator CsrA